ncbi:transposable element Tcb2 transposase [Trichonephila clavipes]|nr:transposable element Tcb2 transposase [Trichonephila clavipes]
MNDTLLQQHLRSAIGTTVSTQTVRNRLHGVGMYARRPMVCVRLTSSHRRDPREWATEHVNWRRNEWSNVLFSDESRFSVHPDNRRIFIWRDRVNRNNPAFVRESVRFGGGDEILRPTVDPYAAAIGDDFILMDDNFAGHIVLTWWKISFRKRNRTNVIASVFSRHESNRARLGRSRKTSCWPPTTPTNSQRTGKSSSGRGDRIPQLVINSLIDSMP